MSGFVQDFRYALRQLARSPGFTAVAILILAMGIGGVTVVFSVVNGVVLQPLPFGEPDRLVRVTVSSFGPSSRRLPLDDDWPTRQRVFEDVFRYTAEPFTLTEADPPVRVYAPAMPSRFTTFLQVQPFMGRNFSAEDVTDPPSVALVSYGFWRNRLGGDPKPIGASIRTDRGVLTVIGVMPRGFIFQSAGYEEPAEMWVPAEEAESLPSAPGGIKLARLNPGVSAETAQAELVRIVGDVQTAYPGSPLDPRVELIPLRDDAVGADWERVLLLFLGAVGFVLVIAVANVANLTLARGIGREREIAIRSAVGSTRSRLVGQFLVESITLSGLGGLAGVIFAFWSLRFIVAALPDGFPRVQEIGIDGSVLAFSLATVLLSGVVFGIVPALRFSTPDLDRVLKESGRGSTEPVWRRRFGSALIAGEVALAAILLTGGLLLARSFVNLIGTPLGMDIENVVVVRPVLSASRYDSSARLAFFGELSERLGLRPDVDAVSVSSVRGMTVGTSVSITINGQEVRSREDLTPYIAADPEVFDVLGIDIAAGRAYREGEETAVVVTESFAERHFPGGNALGQEISTGETLTIVGIARDFRMEGPAEEPVPVVITPSNLFRSALLVRVEGDPGVVMDAIRSEVRAIDPEVVVDQTTLQDAMYRLEAISQPRLRTIILGGFAVVALLLALVGIAGMASYSAAQRTREAGIRMALGATRPGIMRMMLARAMAPVILGALVGAVGAASLTRTMSAYLYEVSAFDPVVFSASLISLIFAAAIASWIPVSRSTASDPMVALRHE